MSEINSISRDGFMAPDWRQLREMDERPAADALWSKLRDLDGVDKQVFAVRGMCALLIEERELYRWVVDREVGTCYVSFDRFLKMEFPNSWSYIRDALRAVKELKDMPFTDLLEIKRANIEQLKKVSSGVRLRPDVIAAAKTLPEKKFVEKLTREYDQHIDTRRVLKFIYDAGDYAEIEKFLVWVGKHLHEPTEDLGVALLAYAIDFNIEHED